jgi:hypothetical protein
MLTWLFDLFAFNLRLELPGKRHKDRQNILMTCRIQCYRRTVGLSMGSWRLTNFLAFSSLPTTFGILDQTLHVWPI